MGNYIHGDLDFQAALLLARYPWLTLEEIVDKGTTYREPVRDRAWKLEHLRHVGGRIVI